MVFQTISSVLATEQSIKSFTFISQGFCLNFKSDFTFLTFGETLEKHLMITASANMFYFAIDYKNKTYIEVAASNINFKIHQLFSKQ